MEESRHGVKKVIGIADVHIPNAKGLDDLKDVAQTFFEQAKKIVEEAGGPEYVRIVIGGDLFDDKITISNEGLLAGYWFLQALDKICPTIVIAGNHDLNLQNLSKIDSITPIFEMSTFKQTRYLDMEFGYKSGFVKDDNVVWCLYSTFSSFEKPEFMPDKETNPDKSVKYIGLIHGEINGATTNNNMVSENALSVSLFDGTDFVIAGHIHKQQVIPGNVTSIVYCSSLKQKNYGESVSGHGFVLYDTVTGGFEFIETPNKTTSFYKFSITDLDDVDKNEEILLNP